MLSSRLSSTSPRPSSSLAAGRTAISSQLTNFDAWGHEEKINFLLSVLPRASYRQLVHVVNWFQDNIPIWSLDFTTVLPRFLSLYIFSFLDTKSLARASSVCWRWKSIADQDILWQNRCIKLGWQLPFHPSDYECGAWKRYYSKNYRQLQKMGLSKPAIEDSLPPYHGSFASNQSLMRSCVTHRTNYAVPTLKMSMDSLMVGTQEKRLQTTRADDLWISGSVEPSSLILRDRTKLLSQVGITATPSSLTEALAVENSLERRINQLIQQTWNSPISRTSIELTKIMDTYSEKKPLGSDWDNSSVATSFPVSYPAWLGHTIPANPNPRILLISNDVPAAELLAVAVSWSTVEALVYNFQGSTPGSLIRDLKALLGHRMARSIGVIPSRNDSHFYSGFPLTANCYVDTSSLDSITDESRVFFCALGSLLLPLRSGGDCHVDLFVPLLMQGKGAELLVKLNSITGVVFHCPQTGRSDYEQLFGNCNWIVTKSTNGLFEEPGLNQTMKAGLHSLAETVPTKFYFEESRLEFWIKSHKLIARSVSKIRRDLLHALEYRTESSLLDRLVGQVAFDEFDGHEFSFAMSVWPELIEAITFAAGPDVQKSIGYNEEEEDDEQIEWRMAQMQHPAVAIASKLLEQAGFCVREQFRPLTDEKASQAMQTAPQSQATQTVSLYLQSTTSNPEPDKTVADTVMNEEDEPTSLQQEAKHATEAVESKDDVTMSTELATENKEQSDKEGGEHNSRNSDDSQRQTTDGESLLLGDKSDKIAFTDRVGEGGSHSSSGVESSAKSDISSKEDYPIDMFSGIRPVFDDAESSAALIPVKLDVTWTIERSRVQHDTIVKQSRKLQKNRMVHSVLFTEADRRLIAVRDLFQCELRYNRILKGVQAAFVHPLNQASFQERAILSANNIKLLFSDLMTLWDISNDFVEALETRIENWVDVEGQLSDVLLTFVCGRWNLFLSYMNNYPVALETLDRCCDEQRLFRSFVARTERTLAVRMLSLAEIFALPFDQLAAYQSHFKRIAGHTEPKHHDMPGLREARKLMNQYCSLVTERVASHAKQRVNQAEGVPGDGMLTTDDSISLSSAGPFYSSGNADLRLLRDCPFAINGLSASDSRFVCRQDVVLMRPANRTSVPFEVQLFEVVDELGFFLFSEFMIITKRRAAHRPYIREADIFFRYSCSVPTRDIVQVDIPDTKYVHNAVEYRSKKHKWFVVFPEQQSKDRFMAIIGPYIESQLLPSPITATTNIFHKS